MNIRIDSVGYTEKPMEYVLINKRLAESRAIDLPWQKICNLVGDKGYAFCVADFNGDKRNKESFKSQQIFALDFDNYADYDEISTRAERYGLPIALAYETLSSTLRDRFRIVFKTAFPIYDIRVAEVIIDALITIFFECDSKCRDVSRMFLGGKRVITASDECMSLERLMMALPEFLKQQDEKHSKSRVEKFCLKHKLSRCGGFAYIQDKQTEDCYEFCENGRTFYFNFDKDDKPLNRKSNKNKVRNFNFIILENKCRLYREFATDERRLHHDELFGIACNLNNIECGKRQFLRIIKASEFEKYREKDWAYYMHYMTAQEYTPMSCENFCPYHEECNHAANMVLTAKTNRNSVVKLKEKEYFTLEEAAEDVKETLQKAVDTPFDGINIIKAQTAIGKTHCYVNLIKNSVRKFIVAAPTNILKDEIYERLKNEGVTNVVKTESIQTLEEIDNEIGQRVREFNSLGTYNDLVAYLKEMAEEEDKEYLLEYIKPLADYCTEDTRVIVTTHKKLLNNKKDIIKEYEIIIDEDILFSAIKNSCTVSLDDIQKIKDTTKAKEFLKWFKKRKSDYILTEPSDTYISYDTMEKRGITTNVNGFMTATSIAINKNYLNCFIPPELIKTKYTILSATANENIYKLFFPYITIRCFNCKEARYMGKLIQDCTRSYSRRDIDSDAEFFENIKKANPDIKHIITFKKYKEQADNCPIHFGNSEGCDFMKGEDILVIGTPHNDESVYKLIATHLGIQTDERMQFSEVEDECYKYWIHTYKNPDLREIQMYFIKSELIQAVGRARLLRYDCTVKLYASIPLPQSEIN